MAGGKETPRQKMIGMMYLVLTALLALNVSKEIVAAFVTINDKLDRSGDVVRKSTSATYGEFDKKRLGIQTQGGDMDAFELWHGKAKDVQLRTRQLVHFILSESNEMIKIAEGRDWIANEKDGYITELESLFDISAMDNYDIPTNRFIGGNPMKPKEEGVRLRDSIIEYRNFVTRKMGTYQLGDKSYSFDPPDDPEQLSQSLKSANEDDTARIAQVYNALTVPETIGVRDAGRIKEMPWASAMFDHAPIVAAGAMLTSIKVDVLTAESQVAEHLLNKIDAPSFSFNKIEPLAFAKSSYINRGDSLDLKVMVAAYDSTKDMELQYWINDSTKDPDEMQTFTSKAGSSLKLGSSGSGEQTIYGNIAVEIKGTTEWIEWEFPFAVGEPQGTVSLPEMNVLYRDYDNKVQGGASGFPSFKLTPGSNVSLTQKGGDGYIARPGSGRDATINIVGIADDGTSNNLGTFEFRVRPLPKPSVRWGAFWDGDSAPMASLRSNNRIAAMYGEDIPLDVTFSVVSWDVNVTGAPRAVTGRGPVLSEQAMGMIRQAKRGQLITIFMEYKTPGGKVFRQSGSFKVK